MDRSVGGNDEGGGVLAVNGVQGKRSDPVAAASKRAAPQRTDTCFACRPPKLPADGMRTTSQMSSIESTRGWRKSRWERSSWLGRKGHSGGVQINAA